jgi:hypothetical protein
MGGRRDKKRAANSVIEIFRNPIPPEAHPMTKSPSPSLLRSFRTILPNEQRINGLFFLFSMQFEFETIRHKCLKPRNFPLGTKNNTSEPVHLFRQEMLGGQSRVSMAWILGRAMAFVLPFSVPVQSAKYTGSLYCRVRIRTFSAAAVPHSNTVNFLRGRRLHLFLIAFRHRSPVSR